MCQGGGRLGNLSTVFSTLLPPSLTNLNNAGPMTRQCRSPAAGHNGLGSCSEVQSHMPFTEGGGEGEAWLLVKPAVGLAVHITCS